MFSEKEVAKYLNSDRISIEHGDERQGHISPIRPTIDRDFELVSMPSPFAELSELALFDRPELEYINESGFLPSSNSFSSILSTWGEIGTAHNSPVTTQKGSSTTDNPFEHRLQHQRILMGTAGLVDVFLVLCARSVGKLISTLTDKNSPKIAPAMLKGKLLLNLDEAQILSGLSRTTVMNAIKNHELPFQLIGKTYLVKSKDLEQFVDNL